MSEVYNDIVSSLNELLDAAQGKETGIVIHRRITGQIFFFNSEARKHLIYFL